MPRATTQETTGRALAEGYGVPAINKDERPWQPVVGPSMGPPAPLVRGQPIAVVFLSDGLARCTRDVCGSQAIPIEDLRDRA